MLLPKKKNRWSIPKYTAQYDPSLLSYLGLGGNEINQRKVANLFKRPTTWKQYCEEVSISNCTIPDSTALRPPQDDTEYNTYYVPGGLYNGHFRKTYKNDCGGGESESGNGNENVTTTITNKLNCTGHFADYPCKWTTFTTQQLYHLDIALDPHELGVVNDDEDGTTFMADYTYSQLVQMWYAANATREHIIMAWYAPEQLVETFANTDYELMKVILPTPTKTCEENRIEPQDRCSTDKAKRVGNKLGACGESVKALSMIMSTAVYETSKGAAAGTSEALWSPAYDVLQLYKFSNIQLSDVTSEYWATGNNIGSPRDAVCQYLVDNFEEFVLPMIPRTYPRSIETQSNNDVLSYLSLVLGCVAFLVVVVTMLCVYQKRHTSVMNAAQVDFMMLVLAGLLLTTIGATISGYNFGTGGAGAGNDGTGTGNASCIASSLLITIGYTLELVPLVVKVTAVVKLMTAAYRYRHVTVSRRKLFTVVFCLLFLCIAYCACWMVLDPPQQVAAYELTSYTNVNQETIINETYHCSSQSQNWQYVVVVWNTILLLWATILALQTRKFQVADNFGDSYTLGVMIYSHSMFLLLRLLTFFFSPSSTGGSGGGSQSFNESVLQQSRSIIFSLDTIITIFIYFVPKIYESRRRCDQRRKSSTAFNLMKWSTAARLTPQEITEQPVEVLGNGVDGPPADAQSNDETKPQIAEIAANDIIYEKSEKFQADDVVVTDEVDDDKGDDAITNQQDDGTNSQS